MTTVVPTSEEDPALAVVRFTSELAWADAGPEVWLFAFFTLLKIWEFDFRVLSTNLHLGICHFILNGFVS